MALETSWRGHPAVRGLGALILICLCFVAGLFYESRLESQVAPASSSDRSRLPKPVPVGDFVLSDIDGGEFTRDRLLNRWTLVAFGYSHCGMYCETVVDSLGAISHRLEKSWPYSQPFQALFVSIDGRRDRPEVLRRFLARAKGSLSGARGKEEQVAQFAQQLGLMHLVRGKDSQGGYRIDHSPHVLVIDPAARLVAGFMMPQEPDELLSQLRAMGAKWAASPSS